MYNVHVRVSVSKLKRRVFSEQQLLFVIIRPRCCLYDESGLWLSDFPGNHLSVCVSVCVSSTLWKNGGSDPGAVWDGRSNGSRDEADSGFWDRSIGMGNFGGKYEATVLSPVGTIYYWEFPLCGCDIAAW